MKKKILIVFLGILVFTCLFALTSLAVDYSEMVVLADGTSLPIYDENQNPLIWYVSQTDENGKNIYASVPNNRNEANTNNDTYVTYTINTSWMTQLENINIHIWNEGTGAYDTFTEESLAIVAVNLRGLTSFGYINKGFGVSNIQCIFFNEGLKDFCDYFQGSTALRLVDLSVCTDLSGGFGGVCNLQECTNLHTIRLAPGTAYSLKCNSNRNYRFKNTAITEIVIPANITNLGVDNFRNCDNLESIYILGNATSLGQRNFQGCTSLTNIYILGDNPTIDITSFAENFYECVDAGKTIDFKSTGKYFFFVSTNTEYLTQVKDAIGATDIITYAEYTSNQARYTEGRYIISGTNICDVYYGQHNVESNEENECVGTCGVCGKVVVNHVETGKITVKIEYSAYDKDGTKTTKCLNDGCTYSVVENVPALFVCLGYSAPMSGDAGIAIGFIINNEAVAEYEATGKSITFGVYAVAQQKLGENDIFDENGNATAGVINADLTSYSVDAFEIKIVGFADTQKDIKLSMGAYVTEDGKTYSYMQSDKAGELVGSYYAVTYNSVIASLEANENK